MSASRGPKGVSRAASLCQPSLAKPQQESPQAPADSTESSVLSSSADPPLDTTESAKERALAAEVLAFTAAIEEYKKWSGRKFPTWSEVLEVCIKLGYRKPDK